MPPHCARARATVGGFPWALGHLTVYYLFSFFIGGFLQIKAQKDYVNEYNNNFISHLIIYIQYMVRAIVGSPKVFFIFALYWCCLMAEGLLYSCCLWSEGPLYCIFVVRGPKALCIDVVWGPKALCIFVVWGPKALFIRLSVFALYWCCLRAEGPLYFCCLWSEGPLYCIFVVWGPKALS